MSHADLNDYGVIGNSNASILVNHLGSIEWCGLPYLDSDCHFGSLFQKSNGGYFQIAPQGDFRSKQSYILGTPVLETHFETPTGKGVLSDWVTVPGLESTHSFLRRSIKVTEGQIYWAVTCAPRFRYGNQIPQIEKNGNGILFRGDQIDELAYLYSSQPLEISTNGCTAIGKFQLNTGQSLDFAWAWGRHSLAPFHPGDPTLILSETTLAHWQKLYHKCPSVRCLFGGPWHDLIARSGILLRLLQTPYSGSLGQSVATLKTDLYTNAVTWKSRYASIRDGALTLQAFYYLGMIEEAKQYFDWIKRIVVRDGAERLQAFYTLDGDPNLKEAQPSQARSDSDYAHRFQLDIYGHALLAISQYFEFFGEIPNELWGPITDIVDYVCQAWKRPDHGPYGMSARPEHHVVSKLFCWVAIDRACWLMRSTGRRPSPRWISERSILHRTICDQGFNSSTNSFVKTFGDRETDQSLLWLPLLHFLPAEDFRVRGTVDAIISQFTSGGAVRQFSSVPSDLGASSENLQVDFWGSFFLISCLAILGQADEATQRLAELCSYSSPTGLFPEKIELNKSESLTLFPSLSVHVSLINAAIYINWAKGRLKEASPLLGIQTVHAAKSA